MSSYGVETVHVARKHHECDSCWTAIRPGEEYVRVVTFYDGVQVWKECMWCDRARAFLSYHHHAWSPDEAFDVPLELETGYPVVYRQLRAAWSYPDGQRLPLPFQPRCAKCGTLASTGGSCQSCGHKYVKYDIGVNV